MKKLLRPLLLTGLVMLLSGCFGSSWNVKVGKDGAGTLTMKMYMSKSFGEMMSSMGGGEAPAMTGEDFMAQNDPQAMAAQLGDGVTVESAKGYENGEEVGFVVVYKFDDINNIRLNPLTVDPNKDESNDPADYIQFKRDGNKLRIKILNNAATVAEDDEEMVNGEAAQSQAMMSMMKDLFASMRFSVVVEATDPIKETNATYREGNTITIMDLEMSKIMDDEELFSTMTTSRKVKDEEMKKRLEAAGIKMEDQVEVTIQF